MIRCAIVSLCTVLMLCEFSHNSRANIFFEGITDLSKDSHLAFVMQSDVTDPLSYGKLLLWCDRGSVGRRYVSAAVYFVGEPEYREDLELVVISADETRVLRIGSPIIYEPALGIHRLVMYKRSEVRRFVNAALRHGALISDGFHSFTNAISSGRNAEVRREFVYCVERATHD